MFDVQCAQCHGVTGRGGGFLTASTRTPDIAGAPATRVFRMVRQGGREMPAFSAAVLPDSSLHDVAAYVQETLGHPASEPTVFGSRALDPFTMGLITWAALAVFAGALSRLFSEGRS